MSGTPACGPMRVYVDDPTLVSDLLEFLHERVHVTAQQVGEHEVEVSQLGSMNAQARRVELDLMLQLWRARNPGVRVSVASGG